MQNVLKKERPHNQILNTPLSTTHRDPTSVPETSVPKFGDPKVSSGGICIDICANTPV